MEDAVWILRQGSEIKGVYASEELAKKASEDFWGGILAPNTYNVIKD